VSEIEIPPELDRIILDCLAKDPADRPESASALYRRLAECPVPDAWSRDRALAWWTLHLPELFEAGARSVDLVGVVDADGPGPMIVPAD
jgi:hypothetical protein